MAIPKAGVLDVPKALPLPKFVGPPKEFAVPKAEVAELPNPVLAVVVVPNELLPPKDELAVVFAPKLNVGGLLLPNEGVVVVLVGVAKGEVVADPNIGFDTDVPKLDGCVFTGPPKILALFDGVAKFVLVAKTEGELFTPKTDDEVVVVVAPKALAETKEVVVTGVPNVACVVLCPN